MMLRLTAVFTAALLVAGCGKKEEKAPAADPVAVEGAAAEGAAADKGAAAEAAGTRGAAAEKAPAAGAAKAAKVAEAPAVAGKLRPPSTNAPNAKVEIIEISDFQCPFCSRVNPTIAQIKKEYGDAVRFTFVHNALSFHKDAKPAAIASVAAQNQGKFWEMHDKLFANQKALKPADLEKYATELGLDMERFKKDMKDPAIAKFVDDNQAMAVALGATGTPAFFINGKNLRGAQPLPQFKAIIDAEIAEADKASKSGDEWIKARTKTNNDKLHGFYFEGKAPPKVPARPKRPVDRTVYKVDVDVTKDAIKGDSDKAVVTLVEFSEFQCPFCKKILPTMDSVVKEYGDKVRVVFKHNPLPFHKQAMPASEAAMCAKDQGKFWEMHDVLFNNQRALNAPDLEKYAGELGLNMDQFKSCMTSGKFKAQILADQELAGKVTARGTPNTFINGRKLTGAKPLDEFKTVIDEEIKKAEALATKTGKSGQALYEEIVKNGKVFEPLEAKVNEFKIDDSPLKGKADAKIQLVEFSDFQCPFCSRVTKPLMDVKNHYGDDAVVVFKHFPLSFHKEAMPAALASMCANEQGKYWELHDEFFANQKALKPEQIKEYAKKIGLDMGKFDACFESQKYKDKIQADMAEGRAAGVRGTPTIYINGRKFNSPSGYNLNAFTSVIDKYLLKK